VGRGGDSEVEGGGGEGTARRVARGAPLKKGGPPQRGGAPKGGGRPARRSKGVRVGSLMVEWSYMWGGAR